MAHDVNRIPLFEGVRGVLASWVMLGHFLLFLALGQRPEVVGLKLRFISFVQNGAVPVALFMLLSGFVIHHLLVTGRESYRTYIGRRFLRLFPAFLVCMLIGIGASWCASNGFSAIPWKNDAWLAHQSELGFLHRAHAVENIAVHLTMLHGLVPRSFWPDATGAFIGVGWSISTEWQFYLVAPLLLLATRSVKGWVLLIVATLGATVLASTRTFMSVFANDSAAMLAFHLRYFVVGWLSYMFWRFVHDGQTPGRLKTAVGMIPAAVVVAISVSNLAMALWCVLLACVVRHRFAPEAVESRLIDRTLCSRAALYLGKISYSLYLGHWPVAMICLAAMSPLATTLPYPVFAAAYIVTASAVSIGLAAALFHTVEAPAIRWAKNKFRETRDISALSKATAPA